MSVGIDATSNPVSNSGIVKTGLPICQTLHIVPPIPFPVSDLIRTVIGAALTLVVILPEARAWVRSFLCRSNVAAIPSAVGCRFKAAFRPSFLDRAFERSHCQEGRQPVEVG